MLAGGSISVALTTPLPIVLVAAISFAALWLQSYAELAGSRPYAGYANYVTALRLIIILCIAATMGEIPRSWVLLAFAANVALDVADGYVARLKRQATNFGAAFDREVDALFVLVAYSYFFFEHGVPGWVLLPGMLPYAYRLMAWRFFGRFSSEKKLRVAAQLAGMNYVLLLAAVAAPTEMQVYVLIASACVVAFSFLVSFWTFHRYAGSIP
jgi:phosphatidylglycerophosphate synthase